MQWIVSFHGSFLVKFVRFTLLRIRQTLCIAVNRFCLTESHHRPRSSHLIRLLWADYHLLRWMGKRKFSGWMQFTIGWTKIYGARRPMIHLHPSWSIHIVGYVLPVGSDHDRNTGIGCLVGTSEAVQRCWIFLSSGIPLPVGCPTTFLRASLFQRSELSFCRCSWSVSHN